MPLSLKKLEKILNNKGILPKKYFVINKLLIYIEVLIISSVDVCLLYIPSKYKIAVEHGPNVFKLSYIELTEEGNIPKDYGGELDNFEMENQYNELDIENNITDSSSNNIAEKLEENYNHPVVLKEKNNENQLRGIFRQLNRLKFCVKNLKYKVCIIFKNYMCCIRRDDTLEGYKTNRISENRKIKFMVSFDLETFFDKINSISDDVRTIREGIYNVLNKNHTKNIKNINNILTQQKNIAIFSERIIEKKKKFSENLLQLEKLLINLSISEKKNVEKLLEIEEKYSNNGDASLHSDIQKTHQIYKYETELNRINVVKKEIITNIMISKENIENISLQTDNICFDNTVMIDSVLKNFSVLSEL